MSFHEHDHNNLDCWCSPIAYRLCPECDGEGCWFCEGKAPWPGLFLATDWEKQDDYTPLLIVHAGPEELPPDDVIADAVQAMHADGD